MRTSNPVTAFFVLGTMLLAFSPSIALAEFLFQEDVKVTLPSKYEVFLGPSPYNSVGIDTDHELVMKKLRWCNQTPTQNCYSFKWPMPPYNPLQTEQLFSPPVADDVNCPNWLDVNFPKDVRLKIVSFINGLEKGNFNILYQRPDNLMYDRIKKSDYKNIFAANVAYTLWMDVNNWTPITLVNRSSSALNTPNYYGFAEHLLDSRCLKGSEDADGNDNFGDDILQLKGNYLKWNPRVLHEYISKFAKSLPKLPASFRFIKEGQDNVDLLVSNNAEDVVQLVSNIISTLVHSKITQTRIEGRTNIPLENLSASKMYTESNLSSGFVWGCHHTHLLFRQMLSVFNMVVLKTYNYKLDGAKHAASFFPDLGLGVFGHNDNLYADWDYLADRVRFIENFPPHLWMVPLDKMLECYNDFWGGQCASKQLEIVAKQATYPIASIVKLQCYDWCLNQPGYYWKCESHPDIEEGKNYWCLEHATDTMGNCRCVSGANECTGFSPVGTVCNNGEWCPSVARKKNFPASPFDPLTGTEDRDGYVIHEMGNDKKVKRANEYAWQSVSGVWGVTPTSSQWNTIEQSLIVPPADSWLSMSYEACNYYVSLPTAYREKRNKFKTDSALQNEFGKNSRYDLDRSGNTVYLAWGSPRCFSAVDGSLQIRDISDSDDDTATGGDLNGGQVLTNPPYTYNRYCGIDFDGNGPYITHTSFTNSTVKPRTGDMGYGINMPNGSSSLEFTIDRKNKADKDIIIHTYAFGSKVRQKIVPMKIQYTLDGSTALRNLPLYFAAPDSNAGLATIALPAKFLGASKKISVKYLYNDTAQTNLTSYNIIVGTVIKFAPQENCDQPWLDLDNDGIPDSCDPCKDLPWWVPDLDNDCFPDFSDQELCPNVAQKEDVDNDCVNDAIDNCNPKTIPECEEQTNICSNRNQENHDYLTEIQNGFQILGDQCDNKPGLNPLPVEKVTSRNSYNSSGLLNADFADRRAFYAVALCAHCVKRLRTKPFSRHGLMEFEWRRWGGENL